MKLEDMQQFEVGGNEDAGEADISLTCLRCPDFHVWLTASGEVAGVLHLAHVVGVAQAHNEEAHA